MSAIPQQIGPYQVQRELGRGGMGVVFLAHDSRLDRQVALKALPEHLASDADRLARFQREAKILASLNHSSIATIHGLEHLNGQPYLVLEYIDGETLEARLSRGAMPVDEALDIARHIAEALEAAHEKGVIHRDLKPGNVMVTSEGAVKVLDFGLARSADGSPSTSAGVAQADSPTIPSPAPIHSPTIPGAIMGTAGYMSPEQARGKLVDRRSDIFSFGCVLYEMLTGSQPFAGETVTDSLGAILHREPDWAALPPTTPPRIRELLVNCLVKDRKNRLHDIGDARLEIERALSAREWSGQSSSAHDLMPSAARSRRDLARLVGAALAGVALTTLVWLALRSRSATPTSSPSAGLVTRVSVDAPPDTLLWECLIAPDGRTVLMGADSKPAAADALPEFQVYARNLDSFAATAIPASTGAFDMCCSPDGRFYALLVPLSASSGRQRIIKGPTDGTSPPVTVAELPVNSHTESIAWPVGDDLFAVQRGTRTVLRIGINTGTVSDPISITVPGVNGALKKIHPLADNTHFLADCNAYGQRGFDQTVGVLDIATGQVRTVVPDASCGQYVSSGHLLFTRADALLAVPFDLSTLSVTGGPVVLTTGLRTNDSWSYADYSISRDGTLAYLPGGVQGAHRMLVTVGPDGKAEPWFPERRAFSMVMPPCISPDGSRAAVTVANANAIDEIWLVEPDRKLMQRLVALPHADVAPLGWMPDGERLIFSRFGDPSSDDGVYLVRADGSEPPVLVAAGTGRRMRHDVGAPLPDGSAVIVDMLVEGQSDLLLVPVPNASSTATPVPPKTLVHGAPIFVGAAVSPDGKLLAYSAPDVDIEQIYLCSLSPEGQLGPRIQATTEGGAYPTWRKTSDGKLELLYIDSHGRCKCAPVSVEPRVRVEPATIVADASDVRIGIVSNSAILADGRMLGVQHGMEEIQPKSAWLVLNLIEELKRKTADARPGE